MSLRESFVILVFLIIYYKIMAIYKIIYSSGQQQCEIYAKSVLQPNLFGFIEIESLLFNSDNNLLINPAEEKLQKEFSGVKRCFLPINSIIRIDEVEKQGAAKIKDSAHNKSNIAIFPGENKNNITN